MFRMICKKIFIPFILLQSFIFLNITAQNELKSVTWLINNLERIGNSETTIYGNPQIIKTSIDSVVKFNGIDDGIVVHSNPLDDSKSFTIEVVFKPDTSSNPENKEQRFVHIQNPDYGQRRMLIELRLTDDNKWFLDTHINTDSASRTLYAENFIHPVNGWYHAALVYDNGIARHYVNGIEEMSGPVEFLPIENGNVSIGMRMNHRSYFKGEIKLIRMTNRALLPEEFIEK